MSTTRCHGTTVVQNVLASRTLVYEVSREGSYSSSVPAVRSCLPSPYSGRTDGILTSRSRHSIEMRGP